MKLRFISIAAPIVWAAFVFVLHVVPIELDDDSSLRVPHADKLVHFAMFAGLSFLLIRLFQVRTNGAITTKNIVVVVMACACYGGLLEFIQSLTPSKRDSDSMDWCADLVGVAAGTFVAWKEWFALIFLHQIRKTK
ncbi:MAG: VanZ family protein [Flavobacteriales bacterium]